MKELKTNITNEISKGFSEIIQLLNIYKAHLDMNTGKTKDEDVENFIFEQMETLKSLCMSHLSRVQSEMVSNVLSWKKRKQEKEEG